MVPFADLEGGYGSLDGYRKFLEMRRKIRADRIRMKQEQEMMQRKFWDDLFLYGGSLNRRGGWMPTFIHGS
jgi:hypothetical protein